MRYYGETEEDIARADRVERGYKIGVYVWVGVAMPAILVAAVWLLEAVFL